MWRSIFLAIGIVLCIAGAECLIVEKVVLAKRPSESEQTTSFMVSSTPPVPSEIKPPEWAPWSLLSFGAVVMLYSYSIPKRHAG